MRKSITQKFDYGCGVACFAFATNLTYKQAEMYLGERQSSKTRFWVKDLAKSLNQFGRKYTYKYVKPKIHKLIYAEGSIVLIRRSNIYPYGHYLIRHNNLWMDPWINLPFNKNIKNAKSGYRKRLPGQPMYVILPTDI